MTTRGQVRLALLVAAALVASLLGATSARAGGSPIGFVSLATQGTLAVIALPNGNPIAHITVSGSPGAVAASVNGRRVLVASPNAGAVTEIDGIHHRVLHVFRNLRRPADVALAYEPPTGIVTPRYAYILEQARGTLAVLDLQQQRIAARLPVGARPEQLAVDAATLWITHAGSATLTRADVTRPTTPRLLDSINTGAKITALVADPALNSVYITVAGSAAVTRYGDGAPEARPGYRLGVAPDPLTSITVALPNLLITADRAGTLNLIHEQNGRRLRHLHLPGKIRSLDAYGGWLVATLPHSLTLLAIPDGSMRTSIPLPSRAGGFAWALR